MTTSQTRYLWFVVAVVMLFVMGSKTTPDDRPGDPSAPRKIFIVYETLDGKPLQASVAVEELRKQGHQVRFIDDDSETPLGSVPTEMKPAIEPARQAGLPALVVAFGERVTLAKTIIDETGKEMPSAEIVREATQ